MGLCPNLLASLDIFGVSIRESFTSISQGRGHIPYHAKPLKAGAETPSWLLAFGSLCDIFNRYPMENVGHESSGLSLRFSTGEVIPGALQAAIDKAKKIEKAKRLLPFLLRRNFFPPGYLEDLLLQRLERALEETPKQKIAKVSNWLFLVEMFWWRQLQFPSRMQYDHSFLG